MYIRRTKVIMFNKTQPLANVDINLFSQTIFKTCRPRESSSTSSMDSFIKKKKQILSNNFTELGRCVCVLGKTGIGKTYAVHNALQGNYVELTEDILKSKQTTLDFLQKLESSESHVILDEYESLYQLIGIREIKKPPSAGKFIIVSQIPIENKFDFEVVVYNFPVPTPEYIRGIAPEASDELIHQSGGDLRKVLNGLSFKSDVHDEFMGPKQFISSLVSKESNVSPMSYLGYVVSEPGNMVAILQENYPSARGVDLVKISESFSDAQVFEDKMYDGTWDLMSYYIVFGCIIPAFLIGHRLPQDKIRPGSIWTKHQNACMRKKKIQKIAERVHGTQLDVETLLLLRAYAEKGNYSLLSEYKIEAKDIDVLNHLSPFSKLKVREVQEIKRNLL